MCHPCRKQFHRPEPWFHRKTTLRLSLYRSLAVRSLSLSASRWRVLPDMRHNARKPSLQVCFFSCRRGKTLRRYPTCSPDNELSKIPGTAINLTPDDLNFQQSRLTLG